jgi:hypothetical protein
MVDRYRTRDKGFVSGGTSSYVYPFLGWDFVVQTGASGVCWLETCVDQTHPRPYVVDGPLDLIDRKVEPTRFYGTTANPPTDHYRHDGWNPTNRSLAIYSPECTLDSGIDSGYWKTKALANMNPAKPVVDLPLFTFELKDFPHMLKQVGETFSKGLRGLGPRDVPEWHLAYSFGWAPLVSDLMSLVKLTRLIEERKAHLRALESGSRIRRTLHRNSRQSISPDAVGIGDTIARVGSYVIADELVKETVKIWFTANAVIQHPLSDARPDPEYGYIQALGLNISAQTLWNAIPWSWLIDYFVNVSDVLGAYRGYIPWKCTRMCVMKLSVAESLLTNVRSKGNLSLVPGGMKTTRKQRTVYSDPTPNLTSDPFLSGSQMAILGSLLTARSMRRMAR